MDLGFLRGGGGSAVLIVLVVVPVLILIACRRWRMAEARAEEVMRLAWLAAEETARAEVEFSELSYSPMPVPRKAPEWIVKEETVPEIRPPMGSMECVVCHRHTTARCARCKAVRYCSGKCQITHWRQGHKDECQPPRSNDRSSGQGSTSKLIGVETNKPNPSESSSKRDEELQHEPDESLCVRSSTEPNLSFDVLRQSDNDETKPFLDKSGTESTSEFLKNSSATSFSSSSSSSLPSPLAPSSESCKSSPLEFSNVASAKENPGSFYHVDNDKASSDDKYPGGSGVSSNTKEEHLTEDQLSQLDSTRLDVNLSGASNIEQTMPRGEKEDESKDNSRYDVGHVCLNVKSSQLPSKMRSAERSSTQTSLHQSTPSGATTQMALEDLNLKSGALHKSIPVSSGSYDKKSFEMHTNLKQQSSVSSVNYESSIGGRHSHSHDASPKNGIATIVSSKSSESVGLVPNGISDIKTSGSRVLQQMKSFQLQKSQLSASKSDISCKLKMLFPYDLFVKLYNCENVDLHPCGLINCGNSCYANAVLQCLAFTRPLTSYLLQGLHTKKCTSRDWCFTCEFGSLLAKSKQGHSPVSPIAILSHINLGHGKQEDAHEFLRYAIDTMQTICLEEARAETTGALAEETTLIQLIFGGYLRSKIKCTRCRGKSEMQERMMDLTVEIHGDIETLEEALARFTATEVLDGENKYDCNRCKSHERAKKKLSVLEAPNVLTIALKRFQSGKFGKLNKAVRFPEHLNLAPYMSGTDDKSPVYSLYAVVVHQDVMNAAFSGHYICYVKSTRGKWYKADDSRVKPVEIERVLNENAYMLLYARCSPRAPSLIRGIISRDNPRTKKDKDKDHPPFRPYHHQAVTRPPDHSKMGLPFPKTDSCSDMSSILSSSEEGSCSTESTTDSISNGDYSEYIFGDSGRFSSGRSSGFSEDAEGPQMRSVSFRYGENARIEREYRLLYGSRRLTEQSSDRVESNVLTKRTSTNSERRERFY